MFQELSLTSDAPLSVMMLMINLAVGVFLSFVLRWHFMKFGSTLSNREEFAQVFPFILLTTILIITVVKSSLALSLGLVGALSIVRFRTPIKEPEELAYLFMAIAMGLGLGAAQTVPTVVAGISILFVMALFKFQRTEIGSKNLYLSIDWEGSENTTSGKSLEKLNSIISKHTKSSDLRRFDIRGNTVEVTYFLDAAGSENLSALAEELQDHFPGVGVTFLDQNQMPSL